jgi:glycosyltransferase involved in cell wall biosynthesis
MLGMSTVERTHALRARRRRAAQSVEPAGRVPGDLVGAVSVVVPCYNTSTVITPVLRALVLETEGAIDEVLVIDNASTDGTPEVVRALIAESPLMAKRIRMLENPSNLGYGGSIKRGFRHLEVIAPYIAVMHSDAQCDAAGTLLDMVEAFGHDPEPDVVLASRFVTGSDTSDYNFVRAWANRFFNAFTRIVCGVSMSDAGTGIMLARTEAVQRMPLERLTSGYQFHPQLNLLFHSDRDLTIAEVPMEWRDAETSVRFSLVRYGLVLTRMLLRFGWRRRILRRDAADAVVLPFSGAGA